MTEKSKQDVLVMALFVVTRDSVMAFAEEAGIPEEQVTDEVFELVRQNVSQVLGDWQDAVRDMIKETIEKETAKCPLGMTCSPSCAFKKVGECAI